MELIDIAQDLHAQGVKVKLLLLTSIHPAPVSKQLLRQLKQKIKDSKISNMITLKTDFLEEKEIISRLSYADKILFLYKETQESSSAAVRMGLLTEKEIITTPIKIFDDVKSVVTQTKDCTLDSMTQTILTSLQKDYDPAKQIKWCKDNSWEIISKRFYSSLQ